MGDYFIQFFLVKLLGMNQLTKKVQVKTPGKPYALLNTYNCFKTKNEINQIFAFY